MCKLEPNRIDQDLQDLISDLKVYDVSIQFNGDRKFYCAIRRTGLLPDTPEVLFYRPFDSFDKAIESAKQLLISIKQFRDA